MNKQKLNIFVDAHGFDQEFQGSRSFIQEIYTLLAHKNDIQLYLGAYDTKNLAAHFSAQSGIQYIQYRSRSSIFRLLFNIPSIIRKYGIDYAHFQYMAPLFKNCRHIITTHDVLFMQSKKDFSFGYRTIRKLLCKRAAKKADLLTTVSAFSKASIAKYFGINPSKINIIGNGVHPRYFEQFDKGSETAIIKARFGFDKFILYVSRIEPRKNHSLLLNIYLELELYRQGYNLVLLGHQSIGVPEFDKLLAELPDAIRNMIFMSSTIKEKELLSFYRAATVFVYPSRAEGFGIPPLEAAATRSLVLCSNKTAMDQYHFFGVDHVDPEDKELFKSRLSAILHDTPDTGSLDRISQKIKQDYCWQQQADKLYTLIMDHHNSITDQPK